MRQAQGWWHRMLPALALVAVAATAAATTMAPPVVTPAPAAAPTPAAPSPVAPADGLQLTAAQVESFLDGAVTWYRGTAAQQGLATTASEQLMIADSRTLAQHTIAQAFSFAHAAAGMVTTTATAHGETTSQTDSHYQSLLDMQSKLDQLAHDTGAARRSTTTRRSPPRGKCANGLRLWRPNCRASWI